MGDPTIFSYESPTNGQATYEIHEQGLIYRSDDHAHIRLDWRDITFLEDQPGKHVDIHSKLETPISISYATDRFPLLLKTIGLRLAETHAVPIDSHPFRLTRRHAYHLGFVSAVMGLAFTGGLWAGMTPYIALLVLIVPITIFILYQPIRLTLGKDRFRLRYPVYEKEIHYQTIESIDFVVKRNDYGSMLCIQVRQENKAEFTLRKFQNIILLFILLQIGHRNNSRANRAAQMNHGHP